MSRDGRSLIENPCEATLKARVWRAKRKAEANALGINVEDLERSMPLNCSNYWSDSHRKMLYHMAVVCCDMFRGKVVNLELDDLVTAAWLNCARRDPQVNGCGKFYLVSMIRYVKTKVASLNGVSKIRMHYFEEMEGFELTFKTKINHTRDVDSNDMVEYLLSLVPKKSTRDMLRMHFVNGIHKAEIARRVGIGKCSVGSRMERALVRIREKVTK